MELSSLLYILKGCLKDIKVKQKISIVMGPLHEREISSEKS